ncbi:MAG TPA: antibiotic biosynthesis monooxygenase family protein [Chloroflexota bacterium]
MAVRIFVRMKAKPGKGPEMVKARMPRHEVVRKDRGCEQFDLFVNAEDPDDMMLVERWTDEESLNAHYALNRPRIAEDLRVDTGATNERYIVD